MFPEHTFDLADASRTPLADMIALADAPRGHIDKTRPTWYKTTRNRCSPRGAERRARMTTSTAPKHTCAVCGRKDTADRMIYSKHTHARYCANIDACRKRRKKVTHGTEDTA